MLAILAPFLGLAALLTTPVSAAPTPGDAPVLETRKWLSNINVGLACTRQVSPGAIAITIGSTCWDWRCKVGGNEYGVNMEAYCDNIYGANNAYASCGGGTVWDWQCHNWE